MAHPLINGSFYNAILHFEDSEEAQEYYYKVMSSVVERNGKQYTVRDQILRVYAMLFCDDIGAVAGQIASPEDVEDPRHWYRMQHHFPVIDEDNYERFAALVIADLSAGPLREAALNGGDMLIVGERDPLIMTSEERKHQKVRTIDVNDVLLGGDKE